MVGARRHWLYQLMPSMITDKAAARLESCLVPLLALLASLGIFGIFMASVGTNPFEALCPTVQRGLRHVVLLFNTLQRAAPLILTALCTAIPAHLGLIVIGGEGALVLGGLGAIVAGLAMPGAPPLLSKAVMAISGAIAGGAWVFLSGVLRHYRGVNETISSLLLNYVAIALLNNHLVDHCRVTRQALQNPRPRPLPQPIWWGLFRVPMCSGDSSGGWGRASSSMGYCAIPYLVLPRAWSVAMCAPPGWWGCRWEH